MGELLKAKCHLSCKSVKRQQLKKLCKKLLPAMKESEADNTLQSIYRYISVSVYELMIFFSDFTVEILGLL